MNAEVEDAQRWEVVGSRGTRRWPLVGLVGLIRLLVVGSLFRSRSEEEGAESLAVAESVESLDDFLATTPTSQPTDSQATSSGTQPPDVGQSAADGARDPRIDAAADIVGPGLAEPMTLIAQRSRFRATRFYASHTVVHGGKDGLFAVHASHFEERRHEVLIVTPSGVIAHRFWNVGGSIAMHWSRDGSQFMFVRDDGELRTSLVVYEVDGAEIEFDLPGIDPKCFRIRVAVPRP